MTKEPSHKQKLNRWDAGSKSENRGERKDEGSPMPDANAICNGPHEHQWINQPKEKMRHVATVDMKGWERWGSKRKDDWGWKAGKLVHEETDECDSTITHQGQKDPATSGVPNNIRRAQLGDFTQQHLQHLVDNIRIFRQLKSVAGSGSRVMRGTEAEEQTAAAPPRAICHAASHNNPHLNRGEVQHIDITRAPFTPLAMWNQIVNGGCIKKGNGKGSRISCMWWTRRKRRRRRGVILRRMHTHYEILWCNSIIITNNWSNDSGNCVEITTITDLRQKQKAVKLQMMLTADRSINQACNHQPFLAHFTDCFLNASECM